MSRKVTIYTASPHLFLALWESPGAHYTTAVPSKGFHSQPSPSAQGNEEAESTGARAPTE